MQSCSCSHSHSPAHSHPHSHSRSHPHSHSHDFLPSDSESEDGQSSAQATIAFSLSADASEIDLSASDEEKPLYLTVSARIAWSSEPSKPITVCGLRNALDTKSAVDLGAFDMVSQTFPDKWISLNLMPDRRPSLSNDWPENLREAMDFITIPSQESGQDVKVQHLLPRKMILGDLPTGRRKNDTLETGELCTIQLNDNIGIGWWQWGDLGGTLKDKKFAVATAETEEDTKEAKGDDWVYGFEDESSEGEVLLATVVGGEGAGVLIL